MTVFPIISITIGLVLVGLLAVVIIAYRRREELPETDYRVFFILGITWLPLGIATDNLAFTGMGAAFLIAGLVNRDKWKEGDKWSELSPSAQRMKITVVLGLALVIAISVAVYFFTRQQ